MIRLVGAVCIITASAVWGFRGVRRLNNHVRGLEALYVSIQLMESELCQHLLPMPELLTVLEQNAPKPADCLYRRANKQMKKLGSCAFAAIWRNAAEQTKELCLTGQEVRCLSELGMTLGKYDIREQERAFEYLKRRLEFFLRKAIEEQERDSKVHAFLGMAAGLMVVILFI